MVFSIKNLSVNPMEDRFSGDTIQVTGVGLPLGEAVGPTRLAP